MGKFKVFNPSNVDEVIDKTPLICFHSSNGAMGPSGLIYVLFDDNSSYAYSTFYEESNSELITRIVNNIPEFNLLIGMGDKFIPQRKIRIKDYELIDLGVGNNSLCHKSINKKFNDYHFGDFVKYVELQAGIKLGDIFDQVEKEIKGNVI